MSRSFERFNDSYGRIAATDALKHPISKPGYAPSMRVDDTDEDTKTEQAERSDK
jgi:hypothetical protein